MPSSKQWEGPTKFILTLYGEHTLTVRYRCPVGDRFFDYYAPRVLLCAGGKAVPEEIHVEISRSEMPLHELGFHGRPIRPRTEKGYWEYEIYDDELVNSFRYAVDYEGQLYTLYVPNAVFKGQPHPRRLLVWINVP